MESANPFIFIAEFSPDLGAKIEWLTELRPQVRAGAPDPSEPWKYFPLCSHPVASEATYDDAQSWRGALIRTEDEENAHKNFDDPTVRPVGVDMQLWPAACALYEQQQQNLFRCYMFHEAVSVAKTVEIGTTNNNSNNNNNTTSQQRGKFSRSAMESMQQMSYTDLFMEQQQQQQIQQDGAGGSMNINNVNPFFDDLTDIVSRIFEEVPQVPDANTYVNANPHLVSISASSPQPVQQQPSVSPTSAGDALLPPPSQSPSSLQNTNTNNNDNHNNNNNNNNNATTTKTNSTANIGVSKAIQQAISQIQIVSFTAPQLDHSCILACVFQIRDPDVRAETRSLTVALCHPDFALVARNSAKLCEGLVNFATTLVRESQFLPKTIAHGQLLRPDPLFIRFAQWWGFDKKSSDTSLKYQPIVSSQSAQQHKGNVDNAKETSSDGKGRGLGTQSMSGVGTSASHLSQRKKKLRIFSQSMKRWHSNFLRILNLVIGPPIDPSSSLLCLSPYVTTSASLMNSLAFSSGNNNNNNNNNNPSDYLMYLQDQQQQHQAMLIDMLQQRDLAFRATLGYLRRLGQGFPDNPLQAHETNILVEVLSALMKGELVVILPLQPHDTQLACDLAAALASLLPPHARKVLSDVPCQMIKSEEPNYNIIAARWCPEIVDRFLYVDGVASTPSSNANNETPTNNVSQPDMTKSNSNVPMMTKEDDNDNTLYTPRPGTVLVKVTYQGGVKNCLTSGETDISSFYIDCTQGTDIPPPQSVPAVVDAIVQVLLRTPMDEPVRSQLCPILEMASRIASGYVSLLSEFLRAGDEWEKSLTDANNNNNNFNDNSNHNNNATSTASFGGKGNLSSRGGGNNKDNNSSMSFSSNKNSSAFARPLLGKRDSDTLSDGGYSNVFGNESFDDRTKAFLGAHNKNQKARAKSPNNSARRLHSLNRHFEDDNYDGEGSEFNNNNDHDPLTNDDDDEEQEQSPQVKSSLAGTFMTKLKSLFSKLEDPAAEENNINGKKGNSSSNSVMSFQSMATQKAKQQQQPREEPNYSINNDTSSASVGAPPTTTSVKVPGASLKQPTPAYNPVNSAPTVPNSAAAAQQQQLGRRPTSPPHHITTVVRTNFVSTNNNNNNNNNNGNDNSMMMMIPISSDYLLPYIHKNINNEDDLNRDQKIFLSLLKQMISIEDRANYAFDPESFAEPPLPKLLPCEALGLFQRLSSHIARTFFPRLFRQPNEGDFVVMINLAKKKVFR